MVGLDLASGETSEDAGVDDVALAEFEQTAVRDQSIGYALGDGFLLGFGAEPTENDSRMCGDDRQHAEKVCVALGWQRLASYTVPTAASKTAVSPGMGWRTRNQTGGSEPGRLRDPGLAEHDLSAAFTGDKVML